MYCACFRHKLKALANQPQAEQGDRPLEHLLLPPAQLGMLLKQLLWGKWLARDTFSFHNFCSNDPSRKLYTYCTVLRPGFLAIPLEGDFFFLKLFF